jgi:tetratricopeptide (TPR) repeat protein
MARRLNPLLLVVAVLVSAATAAADQKSPALDGLFQRLKTATSPAEAKTIENRIWDLWHHKGVEAVDRTMALGIVAASQGDLRRSLDYFDRVVQAAPDFAEGWNKRATIYYMMGDYAASVEDIRRTLALEPRHFGALSGMGLIYDALGDAEAAVKVWEKALEIHPHMEGIRNRIRKLRSGAKGSPT